jgi:hypothetical protein
VGTILSSEASSRLSSPHGGPPYVLFCSACELVEFRKQLLQHFSTHVVNALLHTAIAVCAHMANAPGTSRSLPQRGQPCLRDLDVLLRRREARADGADHLAIDHHLQRPLHFDEASCHYGREATAVDRPPPAPGSAS